MGISPDRFRPAGVELLAVISGASRLLEITPDACAAERRVLEYLSQRAEGVREATLRSATGTGKELLQSLLRRKWLVREDLSESRDASRVVQVAVLKTGELSTTDSLPDGKSEDSLAKPARSLNQNQQSILGALAAAGGRMSVEEIRHLPAPKTTLQTLVNRGLVEIVEEAAEFDVSRARVRPPLDFVFTPAQKAALQHIRRRRGRPRSFRCRCCMASPDRARPRCIWRPCRRCWPRAAAPSCWCRKSA